ncbi:MULTISPECIES: TIR-like protein FxsC [Streptomyces]|uniref:TIR-like protein FxsC n=1 Tax=Streptomyces TaxID=1883 RepID=UPI001F1C62C1|nr:TIR-like protein FxsC [Streptomyces sp. CB01201]
MQGSVGAGGDEQKPYFFLSYAHTPKSDPKDKDPNLWVQRFFRDLCAHVMQLTPLPAGSAGFMDQQMQPGEGWQERLSEALAFCKVFVPLYSPRYFLSEQCGREWFAFSSRAASQNTRHSNNNSNPVTGIVPALWVPVPTRQLPQPAERLQFNHATFGDEYADEGFYGLIKLNYLRDQYERAVYRLAKRIVSVAQQAQLEHGDPHQDYAKVPPAFGPTGGPAREMEVSVLACSRSSLPTGRSPDCYGTEALDWNPYHPASSRPLADHTVDVVRNLNYTVHLSDFEAEPQRLLASGPPGPGLLLLDRWALDARRRRELLDQLGASRRPWISVMVPGNVADPETRARNEELSQQADAALATRVDESDGHRTPSAGLPTLEAFSKAIPGAVKAAVKHYEANAPTYPPPGSGGPMPRVLPGGIGYGAGGPSGRGQSTDQDKNHGDKAEGSSDD